MSKFVFIYLSLFVLQSCSSNASTEAVAPNKAIETKAPTDPSQLFAWPFLEPAKMRSQGGMTKGTPVTLDHDESKWKSIQEKGITQLERDRRAILAMAGDYRVSFQFIETAGFTPKFHPSRPYFSWGTETVRVIKDEAKEISLQHTLCMWFKGENGELQGPMVMKHWRQDWKYEDTTSWQYEANSSWKKQALVKTDVAGTWSQKVYQVDDSPRYFTYGKWQHHSGVSSWKSQVHRRPLPRREFAVRSDYNSLQGIHDITITPNGWVHVQNNSKVNRDGDQFSTLSQETGINRYERISSPDLSQADDYWKRTAAYWSEVRQAWAEHLQSSSHLQIKAKHQGKKLYMYHFSYAGQIKDGEYKSKEGRQHARETINNFLGTPSQKTKY